MLDGFVVFFWICGYRGYNNCVRGHIFNSRGGAFTLIEILIVVILLGVLAAIVVPSFSNTTEDAQLTTCLTNLKIIQGSMNLYHVRNGRYPTTTDELSTVYPTLPTCPLGGAYTWDLRADRYHISGSGQHSPEISHVCIRDTHGPNAR
jgi:prepilin-type N-terminal cleavage/methylation domain-containing protein